ncbi:MAG: 50S ribosomal protein L11 methyltransferase, partial [Alphaproteobacteria bacterium]
AFEAALEDHVLALTIDEDPVDGLIHMEALVAGDIDPSALRASIKAAAATTDIEPPDTIFEAVPETDWVAASQAIFPPIQAGRYYVHGSHLPAAGGDAIDLEVDAGAAFGTGEHESTHGCLLALDDLADHHTVARALDMGCGSGILAMAMAKTWDVPVVASDIDPAAVATAQANTEGNRVDHLVRVLESDGYASDTIAANAPYDLITANILAGPLIAMAAGLAGCLAPGGVAVLAGLLSRQADDVITAHVAGGLVFDHHLALGDWRTLILRRPT